MKLLVFSVRDTGRGVPEAMAAKLFREEVGGKDVRGVGIGLVSCQVLAKAGGGRCWLESTTVVTSAEIRIKFRYSAT